MSKNIQEFPDVVNFQSYGVECVAAVMFGTKYLLNMGTCLINFPQKPKVTIEYLPHSARISFNDGQVWLDIDGESAAKIEHLFSK